jgi:PadR family transcriptional regulator, regulatory protein PadR
MYCADIAVGNPSALSEASFFILIALSSEDLHGYAIVQAVHDLSAGRVRLGAGTLYGALERMSNDGWIAPHRDEVVEGRLRRYYRLTSAGRERALAEADRMEANAAAARGRLEGGAV